MSEPKYLVLRKDGSIPQWPWFVLGANDPAALAAIRAYANECEKRGMMSKYVRTLRVIEAEFAAWQADGQPDGQDSRRECDFVRRLLRSAQLDRAQLEDEVDPNE